jgi:hypothetical protein
MKNLPKDFKLVSLAILVIMLLYSFAEYKSTYQMEQSINASIASTKAKEKQNRQLFLSSKVMLMDKSKQLRLISKQVELSELKVVENIDSILDDVMTVIFSEREDSILRLDKTSLLSRLNTKNTMMYSIDGAKDPIDLKAYAYQLLNEEYRGEHADQILGFESASNSNETKDLIMLCRNMKYVVFAQQTHYVIPEVQGSESFNPGLAIMKYQIFDVATAKLLKEGNISAENSNQVQSFGDEMRTFLKADLERNMRINLKKFINIEM